MDYQKAPRFPIRASAGLTLLTMIALLCPGPAFGAVSADRAVALTIENLLGGDPGDARLFIQPEMISQDQVVQSWKREIFRAPGNGWLLFVDPTPRANWEHPCTYIFVDAATGALRQYPAMLPPATQERLREITQGRDNPLPGESAAAHAWFDRQIQRAPKPPHESRGRSFAFIISGGANQGNNHIRYWNDCSFIYKTLANYYEYPDENIYVCISDGLDPAPDRSDGTNSPADLDGDGDDDIQYPATYQYIELVFNELANVLTASDQLFIFTTDHGGHESGWDCYLNLWNWEEMRDDQLAPLVDALPCESVMCCFEQCYSGGMIDDLESDGHVVATAARYDEPSWAMSNLIYDEFVYYWISAVNWEDPYGVPVDADTNDDGIVSMSEAFIYAEAHDTAGEHPQYSSTPPDLGDLLNLQGNLEGVYLAVDDVIIDDDMTGASHGNGNGVIEYNETIELSVVLHNMGSDAGLGVTGTLTTTSAYVGLAVAAGDFGDIGSGENAMNAQPFVFHVMHDVPDLANLAFTLEISEEPGIIALGLSARAPHYLVGLLDLDDSVGGNGNGIPEPGEQVSFSLAIDNTGGADTPDLTGVTLPASDYFTLDQTPHAIGVIGVGAQVTEPGFSIEIAPSCPEIFTHYVHLVLSGAEHYTAMVPVPFSVGQIFADNIEMGSGSWTHYIGPGTNWIDEWHIETHRNHTPDGTTSWKCGGAGAAVYGNLLYAILETAEFELPPGGTLSFFHWIDAEISSSYPDYCYDGGLLEISTDGGTNWEGLTPAEGYPYRVRTGGTPGPFPAETPVWSGASDWTEVSVDLSSYSGPVKLRWIFGSDGAVSEEGWYIDDVRVYTLPPLVAEDEEPSLVLRPRLFPARPNPVVASGVPSISLRFALPAADESRLTVYDAGGRLVRVLVDGRLDAGTHVIAWDGCDRHGAPVSAGTYYCRLVAGEITETKTVTVIR